MKKGTKSYKIFVYLSQYYDIKKVWWGGLKKDKDRKYRSTPKGFYCMSNNKTIFLGYNLPTIRRKSADKFFDKYLKKKT